ncbi:FAD-dependent oxidoreductase [Exiguobacterium profundum]|uniref:FAD-dependent oxidoreductase n=1 Tax=Exiguobacterium TaxID=33986 RepID=UPI0018C3716A|nr:MULTISPECIES: FAD-dependent oxidoreductase [Exiguobacterium]MBG0917942.1 FAD-dependent oxidoreductase [Exiguobacterium sp. SRB7LM]MDX5980391.1 FAD-dependent oxidoreductase [Exiguobacterium profundum]
MIHYAGHEIKLVREVRCVVVGGGTSGVTAAYAAANEGIDTLLIEKTIALGGTQTNALVSPMMPTHVQPRGVNRYILDRLEERGVKTDDGTTNCRWFNVETLTAVLDELLEQVGCQVLYDAVVIDVLKDEDTITHLIVQTCAGLVAIQTQTVIDASADAVVARVSGIPTSSGDENGHNQQMTFRFEMGGVDLARVRDYVLGLGETFCQIEDPDFFEIVMVPGKGHVLEGLFREGLATGELTVDDLKYFQGFTQPGKPGVFSFNCPHIPGLTDTTDPFARSEAVRIGRQMMQRLSRFLVRHLPGFESAFLLKEATQLGIRESYRIHGKYVLSETDYANRARFHDAIAKGDWYVDVHRVKGDESLPKKYTAGEYYEIPYRALIVNEVTNVIFAGRHISSTFLMQASLRIQPTLRDVGEATGIAVALALKTKTALNELDGALIRERMEVLQ